VNRHATSSAIDPNRCFMCSPVGDEINVRDINSIAGERCRSAPMRRNTLR
jgi:hypothetical protein